MGCVPIYLLFIIYYLLFIYYLFIYNQKEFERDN